MQESSTSRDSTTDQSGLDMLLTELVNAAGRPWDRAISMPSQAYMNSALLELEREMLFRRSWICVGRADEIEEAGSYLTSEIDRVPILVVRQKDGNIKAFANVCRHRGMVVAQGSGLCKGFTCPYHGWFYGLDGRLVSAPHMRGDFSVKGKGLTELPLEQWLGFLFVNLASNPKPLGPQLAELTALLADFQVERMKTLRRDTLHWRCNWKVAVENALEPLHISATHTRTLAPYVPIEKAVMKRARGNQFYAYDHHYASELPVPQSEAYIPNTSGSTRVRQVSVNGGIFPCMVYAVAFDWVWWISCQPVSINEVRVDHGICAPFDMKGRQADPSVPELYFLATDTAFMPEDVPRVEGVQRGMESGFARQCDLSPYEEGLHSFIKYLAAHLAKPGSP